MLVSMGLLSIEVIAFMYIVRYYPILPGPRDLPAASRDGIPSTATPAT
jgi:hypothetical protein